MTNQLHDHLRFAEATKKTEICDFVLQRLKTELCLQLRQQTATERQKFPKDSRTQLHVRCFCDKTLCIHSRKAEVSILLLSNLSTYKEENPYVSIGIDKSISCDYLCNAIHGDLMETIRNIILEKLVTMGRKQTRSTCNSLHCSLAVKRAIKRLKWTILLQPLSIANYSYTWHTSASSIFE